MSDDVKNEFDDNVFNPIEEGLYSIHLTVDYAVVLDKIRPVAFIKSDGIYYRGNVGDIYGASAIVAATADATLYLTETSYVELYVEGNGVIQSGTFVTIAKI